MTVTPAQNPAPHPALELVQTLPGRYYTDQAVFDAEQERIFGTEWVYVAHSGELPASGDVVRRPVGNETVIVVRGPHGELSAFLNVCRHRGAQLCLSATQNVGRAIRCPYHAWTYGLDGALRAAPNMSSMRGLDRDRYGLIPVALTEWNGLLWVNLDPAAPPLTDQLDPQLEYRLGEGADRLDHYGIGDLVVGYRREYDVAANWKIIQENFQECYHCGTIHPELIEQLPSFRSFTELGDGAYFQGGYAFAAGRAAFSLSGESPHQAIPGVVEADTRQYFGMVLRPNCFLSLLPDHVVVHRFQPVSPSRTKVVCEWLFTAESVAAEDFDPTDTVELFHRVNVQDFDASQWCQPNMSSRAYREGGVLVPLESTIIGSWYYPWYRSRMGIDQADRV